MSCLNWCWTDEKPVTTMVISCSSEANKPVTYLLTLLMTPVLGKNSTHNSWQGARLVEALHDMKLMITWIIYATRKIYATISENAFFQAFFTILSKNIDFRCKKTHGRSQFIKKFLLNKVFRIMVWIHFQTNAVKNFQKLVKIFDIFTLLVWK